MRLRGTLAALAASVVVLGVSACGGSSSSNPTSNGAPVNSSAIRKELLQAITSEAKLKPAQANQIIDCILGKMGAVGIKTNAQAESQSGKVEQFSESCTEKVLTPSS
jgi:hypothetical protein